MASWQAFCSQRHACSEYGVQRRRGVAGIEITFRGAAGEVTGSCFEVAASGRRFLVDCGLVQGDRDADARNRSALKPRDATLDFIILTHAHIDHSGLLPRLARLGFRRRVYATPATAELCGVMLPDAAYIQQKDAERARERASARDRSGDAARRDARGDVDAPLYTMDDAESVQDSIAINAIRSGAVIIAASGMCDAGRVRHHHRHNLPRDSTAVVFAGFQAAGTLGRALVDGARSVRLFREDVPVRAAVHTIPRCSTRGELERRLRAGRAPPLGKTQRRALCERVSSTTL